jgi:hypothetical protein
MIGTFGQISDFEKQSMEFRDNLSIGIWALLTI